MSFAINTEKDLAVVKSILDYCKKNAVLKQPGVRRADRDDLWRQVGPQHKNKYRRTLFKIITSFSGEDVPTWAQHPQITDLYLEAKNFQLKFKKNGKKAPANEETRTTRKTKNSDKKEDKDDEEEKKNGEKVEKKKEEKVEKVEKTTNVEEQYLEEEDDQEEFIDIDVDDTPIDPEQGAGAQNAGANSSAYIPGMAGILYVRDALSKILPK